MAFLGSPTLSLGAPSRPSPTSPGKVTFDFKIPLFIDLLEKCMVQTCDAGKAPIFQLSAEIWLSDTNEPKGTIPVTRNQPLFHVLFDVPGTPVRFRRVLGDEISNATPVTGAPSLFLLVVDGTMAVNESQLNEDWGPFPPPGAAPSQITRDEVFLRAYLGSLFSAWQTIDTKDSAVQVGQFFGP